MGLGVLVCAGSARGQETVFDVPSADVLDRGKVYGELDGTAWEADGRATLTPRVVIGVGHGVEVGANFNGISEPEAGEMTVSPTIKWQPWSTETGWSFYAGDDLFFPVRERSYHAGNYFYAVLAKKWKHGTRVGAGGYDFTKNVVAGANRAGGQFTVEQSLGARLTVASEWYTGNQAVGFVNTGLILKLTRKLTGYAAYQLGNAGVTTGNRQFLWELGWNFN